MRVIFAGTPEVAVPTLQALLASRHEVVGVLTREAKRQGRKRELVSSPVSQLATQENIPLLETEQPNSAEAQKWLAQLEPDLGVVVAYGALLQPSTLAIPQLGWLNLHFSALPKLRGAAPVQRAIIEQHEKTGLSVFMLDEGMDTGPLVTVAEKSLDTTMTAGEVLESFASLGAEQVVDTLDLIDSGQADFTPQDSLGQTPSYAPKLVRQDAFIDFSGSADQVSAHIRGVTPAPGAWTTLPGQVPMKLGKVGPVAAQGSHSALRPGQVVVEGSDVLVGCGAGVVKLGQVAPAGKSWMQAQDWARGARLNDEYMLGRQDEI